MCAEVINEDTCPILMLKTREEAWGAKLKEGVQFENVRQVGVVVVLRH